MILLECPYYDSGHSCEVFYYSSRVGATLFQGTVPNWDQSSPRWYQSSSGSERDDFPSGNPWDLFESTTTYVGESDNIGSRDSCSSTTVTCYTCHSRWTVYAGCDRAHDCGAKGLSWVPYYITAGQYDYTDLRLSWELVVWLLWRMFECLVLDINLFVYIILFSHTSCRVCGVVFQIF